jgi:hypothetical protein
MCHFCTHVFVCVDKRKHKLVKKKRGMKEHCIKVLDDLGLVMRGKREFVWKMLCIQTFAAKFKNPCSQGIF